MKVNKKIVKSLEQSGLLIKIASETTENEAKEQKGGFFSFWLGKLGPSLLGNIISERGARVKSQG